MAEQDNELPEPWEPFDPVYLRGLIERVFEPISTHWFRPVLVNPERIPRDGPVVIAANHSGNAFPYDAMVFDGLLWQRDGFDPLAKLRSVFEKELSFTWWMRPFGIDDFWRRGGGVDMLFDNFERLLARGERVLYFPEGVPGIGKGFHRRYQLQRFSTSFVLLAARQRVPVLPLYIVNAEWVAPVGYPVRPLDALMQRLFTVPFLPLPIGLAGVIFPFAWYLAFPAHMTFVIGEPLDMAALVAAEGITDLEQPDREALRRVAEKVRRSFQAELDREVAKFGSAPYDGQSLWPSLRAARGRLWRVLPTGWPVSFIVHERNLRRPPARNRLHAVLRDWDLIGFYLPLVGWPLLSLARRLRRPPYGYRGMDRAAARRQRGELIWRLAERPLPSRAHLDGAASGAAGAAGAATGVAPSRTPAASAPP
ncbi:MAG TPA: 1-acyl-sn-glycerol-3-phosphate acyltransferase [Gemmatimonadaceae bacterium]|nr:1-acyl-sn-glycerol-3-phosphate acyltransferase [Gemmatimonadaceae bacterium]